MGRKKKEDGKRVVVFLQNAWSPAYAGREWPRESWLRAMWGSRTGRRMEIFESSVNHGDISFWYDNTTREVTPRADMKAIADLEHIQAVLDEQQPHLVVACGVQARECLVPMWQDAIMVLPHPTYRPVTDKLFRLAGELVWEVAHQEKRLVLTQLRGNMVDVKAIL